MFFFMSSVNSFRARMSLMETLPPGLSRRYISSNASCFSAAGTRLMTQLLIIQSAVLSGSGIEVMAPWTNPMFSALILILLVLAFSIMFFAISLVRPPGADADRMLTRLVHVNSNCRTKRTNPFCGCEDIEARTTSKVNNGFALRKLARRSSAGHGYTCLSQLSKRKRIAAAQSQIRTLWNTSQFFFSVPEGLGDCLFVLASATLVD